jgi:hypothetical protein
VADAAHPALATAEDQVDNVYRPLQAIVRGGVLGDQMRVGEEFIRLPNDGRIDVVTSSARPASATRSRSASRTSPALYTKQNG